MWPCGELHQGAGLDYKYTSKKVSFLLDQAFLLICLMATNVLHVLSIFLQSVDSSSRLWISTVSHLTPISLPTDSQNWPLSLTACCPTHLLLAAHCVSGYNWGLS